MMQSHKSVLEYIIKEVELSVSRLGINTNFSLVEEKDYTTGRPYLKVVSTPFQTMPVIFKKINLEGSVHARPSMTDDKTIEVLICLEYRYSCFDGGSNGHHLGNVKYEVEKELWETWDGEDEQFLRYRINKVHGIEI